MKRCLSCLIYYLLDREVYYKIPLSKGGAYYRAYYGINKVVHLKQGVWFAFAIVSSPTLKSLVFGASLSIKIDRGRLSKDYPKGKEKK